LFPFAVQQDKIFFIIGNLSISRLGINVAFFGYVSPRTLLEVAGMNINCENCRASYRLDVAMFKGARGMSVRCRRCGKSILVLKPEEIASDMSVPDRVASEGNRSGYGSTDPAVSPAKEEYSPPQEVEQVPSVEEQARISPKNREEEEYSFAEAGKKSPLGPVPPNAFTVLYPLLPKSPPKDLRRRTFKWSSIIGFSLPFIFLGG
jgi:predicted Zn finger-like uncharacterized protein